MNMCYDGALVMPSNYAVMYEEEMSYVDGGCSVTTVCAIIGAVVAAGGATYGAGRVCGERLYYAGINTSEKWGKYKVQARLAALAVAKVGGAIFMLGVENKLYSMM